MSLDIRWIEDILALDAMKSISKAAEHRFVSQSAFTRRIQQIELDLGQEILVRNGKNIEFNEVGQVLLSTAKNIKDQLDLTLSLLNKLNTQDKIIKFSVSHSLMSNYFSQVVKYLPEKLKDFHLEIATNNVGEGLKNLKEGICHFLICYADTTLLNSLDSSLIAYHKLGEMEIIPVCTTEQNYDLENDQHLPLLTYGSKAYLRKYVDKIIQPLDYKILYETDNALDLKELVLQGLGIAWLPRNVVNNEIKQNKLKIINDTDFYFTQEIYILKSKINRNPNLQLVWENLIHH
ncbi:LysR family transcriptional regulator [Acinetobacter defluvii]|uniref:LysR substrate-binding domain-containing protein n=1 Tax=Acinetobacter defluvii TaxID=1871111 RepID=UPI00148FEDF5|nr:LysR substrate-binding domain-containing protein [Acinetobacter defluvii]NNP71385.1 LysR family transcriptional regulator [Acinetobacter defluvii]